MNNMAWKSKGTSSNEIALGIDLELSAPLLKERGNLIRDVPRAHSI